VREATGLKANHACQAIRRVIGNAARIRGFCSAKSSKILTSGKLQRQTFTTQISAINPSCEELTSTKKNHNSGKI
jgi:hypothetical protein